MNRLKKEVNKYFKCLKEQNSFLNYVYYKAHCVKVRRRSKLSDDDFAQAYYMDKKGESLNLINPRTYDEKLWWMKLHYHNPLMTICVDKYAVRQYVADVIGVEYLNDLFGVYDSVDEIDMESLPNEFFVKVNHMSGGLFWCHNKAEFPIQKVKKRLSDYLKYNYFEESREWPYKNVIPKIIVEKVLKPVNPPQLIDYRFFCFGGICKFVMVGMDMCDSSGEHNSSATLNVYDREKNYVDVKATREHFPPEIFEFPHNYYEMRDCAEKLSKPFPAVRVDLYSFDNIIRFGEMTFFNMGGVNDFEPQSFQYELGDLITLPVGEYVE